MTNQTETRAFLELDHAKPRALGGGDEAENLRIRCRAHNQLWAEQSYGREHVAERRRLRREKSMTPKPEAVTAAADTRAMFERVRKALTGMGFRTAEARQMVEQVEQQYRHMAGSPAIEQVLREALLFAPSG